MTVDEPAGDAGSGTWPDGHPPVGRDAAGATPLGVRHPHVVLGIDATTVGDEIGVQHVLDGVIGGHTP